MRDPVGSLTLEPHKVVRHLHDPMHPSVDFLKSSTAKRLAENGLLVPYTFVNELVVESPRLPFVSYPHEWSNAQLRDAGMLTLDLSESVLETGCELKDASAWNVIFNGTRPVFCDHLSFLPIMRREWWAFGQFVRHFLFPLALARHRGMAAWQSFGLYRDGMPADQARALLGARRFLTRLWPLMVFADSDSSLRPATTSSRTKQYDQKFHHNLYSYCRSSLSSLYRPTAGSAWSRYIATRTHYRKENAQAKLITIDRWLKHLQPEFVVDLGCNTGEFSMLAASRGSIVVALDYDHDCIEQLHLHQASGTRIHPVLCHLGDLTGGRGWLGQEFPGLAQRLYQRADVLLMLALVHHLVITEGISLAEVAAFAAAITRSHAIVELIDAGDPMVQSLALQRERDPGIFTLHQQLDAFAVHFDILEQQSLPESHRHLVLLKSRSRI